MSQQHSIFFINHASLKRSLVSLLVLLIGFSANAQRNPLYWPFTKTSIWNMPIGSNAEYQPANFSAAGNVGLDIQHIIITNENDPIVEVTQSPTFLSGRCSGTIKLGFSVPFPRATIIPDAGDSPYGGTPNSNFAIIYPDGETVLQSSQISRCEPDGPVYMPDWLKYPANRTETSIKTGDGLIDSDGQGASGMSSLGGTIRLGELIGHRPLRHAIKINPYANTYVHYSDEKPGFKWPAKRADGYANDPSRPNIMYNKNADPNILMGSLFAIPPSITPESLGIQTVAGLILFETLQNFGMYFTEDAAYDTWDIIVEEGVGVEFTQTYGFSMHSDLWEDEINTLMQALHVITNNTPSSIGGGGIPLVSLAPDFGIITAPIGKTIALQSNTGKYVSSENGTMPVIADRNYVGGWEHFTVIDVGNGKVALQGNNDRYVSSENGIANMTCNRESVGDWEQFEWVTLGGSNAFALKGNNNLYVSSENGSKPLTCSREGVGGWEQFNYIIVGGTSLRVGVASSIEPVIKLFPNPAKNRVKISGLQKEGELNLVDQTGKVVKSQSFSFISTIEMNLQDVEKGLYFLIVNQNGGFHSYKLLVNK